MNTNDYFGKYLNEISEKFQHKETSELGYRSNFEIFLKEIFKNINVKRIDHDPKSIQGNKPDFVIFNKDVPILYLETKDISTVLDKVEKSKQMEKYFGYTNLVLTDYVEFRFYRNGIPYQEPISIAKINSKTRLIEFLPQNFEFLAKTLIEFTQSQKEPIKSGVHLSKIMGGKARRIRDNIKAIFDSNTKSEINNLYEIIKKLLMHDISTDVFSDMYAQTLVYGLFAARYYDETPEVFTRQKAREIIPASNPFLRHFFDHIAGPDFEKKLSYIVDELCLVFQHSNIKDLLEEYMEKADPIIHFYEDFLKEYDSDLRKKMGAYYTPPPIVEFIINRVDEILKNDFKLINGLADDSKLPNHNHKVQILDPAVGTGTFISTIIRHIYKDMLKNNQKGSWTSYVHNNLLPRLHGFELMMAPYTIAHLKLSLAFKKTGFTIFNRRLGIYLTNSLEQSPVQQELLSVGFAESIAEEAKQADIIKKETPIMVVVGNPPYNISSSNKGEWILNLIQDYKKNLGERKINLDDDYIKFIRFAEYFIEKNKTGIVAMITNNSFIDGITHRQMRKHLLETFDKIFILNLHGNSKKKEKTPDGGKDENVFDIRQGVSISIFIRTQKDKENLGGVYHSELFGLREEKFEKLQKNEIKWEKLNYSEPYYFFVPKDFSVEEEYSEGFLITDLFNTYSAGIKTKVDNIAIDFNKKALEERIEDIIRNKYSLVQMIQKFDLNPKTTWEYDNVLKVNYNDHCSINYDYRPFDQRYIYYDKNFLSRSRSQVMDNFFNKDNLSIETSRVGDYTFVSKNISDEHFVSDNSFKFPLYVWTEDGSRLPNFKREIINKIEKLIDKFEPENLFDYIYAILYSPKYREKYKEFLKIDFPRIPYPKNKKQFTKYAKLGKQLRELHLMESDKFNKPITTYNIEGDNKVEKVEFKNDNVFINNKQLFGSVPKNAWEFYIGGYQPAQKWLKDRKNRELSSDDINHYQKIIVALVETQKIMEQIDKIK